MPNLTPVQISQAYKQYLEKINELKKKKLDYITQYRKKSDANYIEKLKEDIRTTYGK